MDTPVYSPVPPTHRRPHVSRVIGVVLIIVVIAAAAGAVYWYYHGRQQAGFGSTNARVVLSADSLPAQNALLIDFSKKKLVLDHISSQGTQVLYADVQTPTAGYYLISGPQGGQSTLYKLDLKNPSIGLQQLSTSTTNKVDLSVNEGASIAAFTAYTNGTSPHIVVIDLRSQKETDLGPGTDPTILGGGTHVLFKKDDTLISKDIVTGQTYELAKVAPGAPFAVYIFKSEFSLYDPTTKAVKRYWIINNQTASNEVGSLGVAEVPRDLFYSGGTLYLARLQGDSLIISDLISSMQTRIAAPGFSFADFTIQAYD